jgi:hypothetical protein
MGQPRAAGCPCSNAPCCVYDILLDPDGAFLEESAVCPVRDVRTAYRRRRIRIILLAVATSIGTLLVAPLILVLVAKILPQSDSWSLLSNVGQSFTGISAILSALALGAIAYTSNLQARQVRTGQVQAVRSAHINLIQMAIGNENLARTFGYKGSTKDDFNFWKVAAYRNLIFMYLQMAFRVDELSEQGLRRTLSLELFIAPESIDYWNASRIAFVAELTDPLGQTFIEIVDEEAVKAQATFGQLRRRESPESDGS